MYIQRAYVQLSIYIYISRVYVYNTYVCNQVLVLPVPRTWVIRLAQNELRPIFSIAARVHRLRNRAHRTAVMAFL